jgi:hypothetical protein
MKQLATELLKVAKEITAESSLIGLIVDQHDVAKLDGKVDEQTYELMVDVYLELSKILTLTSNQDEALKKLKASVDNQGWREDMHRNNIFKAAHALGMKLPSSMF